ncbi:putative anti-sigma factor [Arcticibacter svalbardensis MN12-7]|uniref:Putative anti-sigma factor n=1 Tax=Arcticibacter svalbardensis MN12-7 TaxID=1150600 RepID=R9GUV1_9SPHI|nr:FecR family protein [Arcticibacter svalbardensis]EOR92679.1 putative anti-sigma factor [Arcticibacter svalbardensis MN12-7]
MQDQDAKTLLSKFQAGTCTDEEKAIIENWIMFGHVTEFDLSNKEIVADLAEIRRGLPLKERNKVIGMWPKIAAAASVLLIISVALLLHTNNKTVHQKQIVKVLNKPKEVIVPGSNKAFITLADGSKISLTDASSGRIAKENGVQIIKTSDGKLIYTISETEHSAKIIAYNTITTPRGGQYQIVLPDGTHVWLNAATSLKYPTSFIGKERKVELNGEAYFEVAPNKSMPFKVQTRNQEVEVLGTHFNVNSYADENETKTTLLEGSIRVFQNSTQLTRVLRPGQQSIIMANASVIIRNGDLEETMAWKNEKFVFNDQSLAVIMRQISRWYDVDVEFAGNKAVNKAFGGTISRFKSINQVLEILELTGSVRFKVEGRRVIVMN